jgi:hypothetical protein
VDPRRSIGIIFHREQVPSRTAASEAGGELGWRFILGTLRAGGQLVATPGRE